MLAATYQSHAKLPPFAAFGKDVANRRTLAGAAAQIAYNKEIVLVCGDGSAYASPTALNTVAQFYALKIHHVLYVSDSTRSCETLRDGLPSLACVWSSEINATKPDNAGLCNKLYWDHRFYFYLVRKRMVVHLAIELGYNVLQTDTDVAWFASPYPLLKTAYADVKLISQRDVPLVNAGVFYVQNARPGDGVDYVLTELARRIELFMFHPEAVKRYVPWAIPPYFSNSDEQTLMNDVLFSSMMQVEYYVGSTAIMEVRSGGSKSKIDFTKTHEYELKQKSRKAVARVAVRRRTTAGSTQTTYPLRPLGKPEAEPAYFAIAPHFWLHSSISGSSPRATTVGVDVTAEARAAEAQGLPPDYATHRSHGAIMTHLAGLRTGAWSRRAMLRAQGLWHARADVLAGRAMGWGQHPRHLVLNGSAIAAARGRMELDVLVGNLFLLAALTDSLLVVPDSECFETKSRGYAADMGGLLDAIETVPRLGAGGETQRACAWVPPKNCWRTEFLTRVEWERRLGQTATSPERISAYEALGSPLVRAALGPSLAADSSEPISEILKSRALVGGANLSFSAWVARIQAVGELAVTSASSMGKGKELNTSLSHILKRKESEVELPKAKHRGRRETSATGSTNCMASLFLGSVSRVRFKARRRSKSRTSRQGGSARGGEPS